MNPAGSKDARRRRRIAEIDELLKHKARQYREGDLRTATIARGQINQLLKRRRELLRSLGKGTPFAEERAMLDNAVISGRLIVIGSSVISLKRAGTRSTKR